MGRIGFFHQTSECSLECKLNQNQAARGMQSTPPADLPLNITACNHFCWERFSYLNILNVYDLNQLWDCNESVLKCEHLCVTWTHSRDLWNPNRSKLYCSSKLRTICTIPASVLKRLQRTHIEYQTPRYFCLKMKEISTFQKNKI